MIIRRFLQFIQTATAAERAAGAHALARAYLISPLDDSERAAAEAAMTVLLDDTSPQVRLSLADVLAASPYAPRHIILGLVADQPQIAGHVVARSPVLLDAELVELVGRGEPRMQRAIAERRPLSAAVAAAIAEVADADACAGLLGNDAATIADFSLTRMTERYGEDAIVRDLLLRRADLPVALRQKLIADLSNVLGAFVSERAWLPPERAHTVARDSLDRATLALVLPHDVQSTAELVTHLAATRQLNAVLMLRALCMGNVLFLQESLVLLTRLPVSKVANILHDRAPQAVRALLRRAGLSDAAHAAFQAALDVLAETEISDRGSADGIRQVLERVLTRYGGFEAGEGDHLLMLLRRFAAEAAREEARRFAADYAASPPLLIGKMQAA